MGLREKRLAEEVKTKEVVEAQTAIQNTSGKDISIDVNWETFIAYNEEPLKRLRDYVLPEIVAGIEGVCVDTMGKEAFAERVKKITITNLKPDEDADNAKPTLKEDGLDFTVSLAKDYSYNYDRNQIQKYLEDNL